VREKAWQGHLLRLQKPPCLFLPAIAADAVFEIKEFTEGEDVVVIPFGDLAPSMDTMGVKLFAQDVGDPLDLGEVVTWDIGENADLLEGFLKCTPLVFQRLDLDFILRLVHAIHLLTATPFPAEPSEYASC
jgi:hypothetical protein